jgi:hypothetical protein
MKFRPLGAQLFHSDGQTGRHAEANSRFSQFCEGTQQIKNRPTAINFRKSLQITIMSVTIVTKLLAERWMGRIMMPRRSINCSVLYSGRTFSGSPSDSSFGTGKNSSVVIRYGRKAKNSSEASNAQVKNAWNFYLPKQTSARCGPKLCT